LAVYSFGDTISSVVWWCRLLGNNWVAICWSFSENSISSLYLQNCTLPNWSAFWRLCCVRCLSQLVPSKMYWTTFCAEKNLLVLPKLLKITLNIINLIQCIYLLSYLKFRYNFQCNVWWCRLMGNNLRCHLLVIFWKWHFFCNFWDPWKCFFIFWRIYCIRVF
jgi:hypothetical protein